MFSVWGQNTTELRRHYGARTSIPAMREAIQVTREVRWAVTVFLAPTMVGDMMAMVCREWKYGVRSRYIVRPDMVDSLMVHWVHRW